MGKSLSQPNIRNMQPGYSNEYYDIFENLDEYSKKLFSSVNITPIEISLLEGESNVILKVFEGSKYLIVRISPFTDDLFISNYFYTHLENTDVPVPKVFNFDNTHKIIPYDFQILEFLDGIDLRNVPLHLHEEAGALIGNVLRKIHQIKVNGFGYPQPSNRWSTNSWLDALKNNYFDNSLKRKQEIFSPEEIKSIEEITFDNEKLNIASPFLIHSDIGHGNGLFQVRNNHLSLVGFIDPGGIIGGNPMFDLAVGSNDEGDFGKGISKGYTSDYSISEDELYRFSHLKCLSLYWSTCWHYTTKREGSRLGNNVFLRLF